jgi:hypothetical protein
MSGSAHASDPPWQGFIWRTMTVNHTRRVSRYETYKYVLEASTRSYVGVDRASPTTSGSLTYGNADAYVIHCKRNVCTGRIWWKVFPVDPTGQSPAFVQDPLLETTVFTMSLVDDRNRQCSFNVTLQATGAHTDGTPGVGVDTTRAIASLSRWRRAAADGTSSCLGSLSSWNASMTTSYVAAASSAAR